MRKQLKLDFLARTHHERIFEEQKARENVETAPNSSIVLSDNQI